MPAYPAADVPTSRTFPIYATTLSIGAAGYLIALYAGFPAAALTGPSLAVTVAGLCGIRTAVPGLMRDACFVVIGLSMGQGVTPEVYETVRQWPAGFVVLTVSILTVFFACKAMLEKIWNQDRETAILSSSPGHLSYILGLSAERHGDIATISVIQSIRVLALTILVPFAIALAGYGTAAPAALAREMPLAPLLISMVCAIALGFALKKLRIPAAFLLGGMFFSTATHLTGMISGNVPGAVAMPAFAIMGTLIGTRFSGVTMTHLRKATGAGLAVTAIAVAITLVFGAAAAWVTGLPVPQILIAFAPGGVEAMAAMAILLNADPAFVAAHHVWRLIILTFLAPWMLGRSNQ